ncbi:hypothetical protein H4219_002772 [Mycoemilia scoparia]|uniref:Retrotransposon gag domain-containing protein n=1 Tax=Mycoemilia scoparia TaxID=417184 RepID=A0A9W7ZXD6_9FUNG|nr:hypothetical protein H4219_002772 [Mycoemilia scoparia]
MLDNDVLSLEDCAENQTIPKNWCQLKELFLEVFTPIQNKGACFTELQKMCFNPRTDNITSYTHEFDCLRKRAGQNNNKQELLLNIFYDLLLKELHRLILMNTEVHREDPPNIRLLYTIAQTEYKVFCRIQGIEDTTRPKREPQRQVSFSSTWVNHYNPNNQIDNNSSRMNASYFGRSNYSPFNTDLLRRLPLTPSRPMLLDTPGSTKHHMTPSPAGPNKRLFTPRAIKKIEYPHDPEPEPEEIVANESEAEEVDWVSAEEESFEDADEEELIVKKISIIGMSREINPWTVLLSIETKEGLLDTYTKLDTGASMTSISKSLANKLEGAITQSTMQIQFGIDSLKKDRIGQIKIRIVCGEFKLSLMAEILPGEMELPILISRDVLIRYGIEQFTRALLTLPGHTCTSENDNFTEQAEDDSKHREHFLVVLAIEIKRNQEIDPDLPCPIEEALVWIPTITDEPVFHWQPPFPEETAN